MDRVPLKPGIAPRQQLEAQRQRTGNDRWGYLPHQGAKERARRLREAERPSQAPKADG